MDYEFKLTSRFYEVFWFLLISIIVLSIVCILLLIFRTKIISNDNIRGKGIFYFSLIACLFFNGWLIYKFIPYGQDLQTVRTKEFSYITGEVVGYNKREAIGDIAVTYKYSQPIIFDGENRVILEVNDTELNKTYSLIYLKHTKMAIIIETH